VQVTHHGGYHAFETPDGQWLYVINARTLSRMRPDGSEETPLRNDTITDSWILGGHHVFLLAPSGDLQRAPIGGSVFETVYPFGSLEAVSGGGTSIAVPHDESYLIYRRITRSVSTLILIEGFR
jgi:hypothetical protein